MSSRAADRTVAFLVRAPVRDCTAAARSARPQAAPTKTRASRAVAPAPRAPNRHNNRGENHLDTARWPQSAVLCAHRKMQLPSHVRKAARSDRRQPEYLRRCAKRNAFDRRRWRLPWRAKPASTCAIRRARWRVPVTRSIRAKANMRFGSAVPARLHARPEAQRVLPAAVGPGPPLVHAGGVETPQAGEERPFQNSWGMFQHNGVGRIRWIRWIRPGALWQRRSMLHMCIRRHACTPVGLAFPNAKKHTHGGIILLLTRLVPDGSEFNPGAARKQRRRLSHCIQTSCSGSALNHRHATHSVASSGGFQGLFLRRTWIWIDDPQHRSGNIIPSNTKMINQSATSQPRGPQPINDLLAFVHSIPFCYSPLYGHPARRRRTHYLSQ